MNSTHFSAEAEEQLLSCVMIDGVDIVSRCVTSGIAPRSFFDPKHGMVFECAMTLVGRGTQPDVHLIAEMLKGRGQFEQVGGYPFLTRVSSRIPTTAHAGESIARVLALARQRALVAATASAHEAAKQNAGDWPEVWDRVEPHLRAAQDAGAESSRRSIGEIAARAAQWRKTPEVRPTTPTPWPGWDRLATAPRAGELIVVAGRPGTGKTTLAGNIAHDCAALGRTVAFFSLEMGGEELVDRFAMRRAGRDGIGNDRHATAAVTAQIEAVGKLKGLHIFEADDARGVAEIEATCRLLAAAPAGLSAVVIDYLQLVAPPSDTKREPREQQVAAMSRRFKLMARAVNCPVFLLAQLNRESEKEDRRPRLSDLRESGSIEQDADRVWFLHRPKPPVTAAMAPEDASVIDVALYQCKCRNGPAGIEAAFKFNRPTFTFAP